MTDALTDYDLDSIEAKAAAATVGPWEARDWRTGRPARHNSSVGVQTTGRPTGTVVAFMRDAPHMPPAEIEANAAFIAAARQAVPALVAEVRRLRAELEAARFRAYCDLEDRS